MKRCRLVTGLLSFLAVLFISGAVYAADITTAAESAMLVDADSGKILYQKNPDELLPPASMTKMMSEYIILDAITKGKLTWDRKVPISEYGYKISQKRNLSNVPLRRDGEYTVKELYEAMAIYSANAAAITLAEATAGTEANFIKMMNDKAAQLGLKNYKFVNCTGLNNSDLMGMHPAGTEPDAENMISSRSAALLAYRLLKDHPEILQTSSIPKAVFRPGTTDAINMPNWNWMLPGLIYAYEGCDGLKTGSSPTAGYSFTGTAKRGDIRLIAVVMKTDSYFARFAETKKLFDYGFNNYVKKEVIRAGYKIPGKTFPVVKGKEKTTTLVAKKPLSILVRRGEEDKYEPYVVLDKTKVNEQGELVAPIAKGQTVGLMGVKEKGNTKAEFLEATAAKSEQVEAVTPQEVPKANFLVLLFRWIWNFFAKQ